MTQERIAELQRAAGLPESWQPSERCNMIEGLNFKAMLRGRLEISHTLTDPPKLCIQTENGDIWHTDQILIVNDGPRAERERCFGFSGKGRK